MSKMSELAAELSELRRCGETLISISETLVQLFSAGAEEPAAQAEPEKTYSFTEVRGILADKSRSGHREAVREESREKRGKSSLRCMLQEQYEATLAVTT